MFFVSVPQYFSTAPLYPITRRPVDFFKIGFLTEQANFLVFFLRKITILWGWVFLAMARCQ